MNLPIRQLVQHPLKTVNHHKELRYLVAGTISETIEYFSFLALYAFLPRSLYITNSLSFVLGVISGFILHKLWTFRGTHQFKTHQQFLGYIGLAGVNFVAINLFLGLYTEALHLSPAFGKLLAIATTVVWTYVLTNVFIFKPHD